MCTSKSEKRESTEVKRKDKPNRIIKAITTKMILEFIAFIKMVTDIIVDFFFSLYWEWKKKPIPDLEKRHGMLKESAVTLAEMIRTRKLTSEELVRACIERIQIVNPILNAVTDERFEDALKDARLIDSLIRNGVSDEYFRDKPFLGVPFTCKESHAVKGMLHTLGLVSRKGVRADEDAECVRLLKAAGAICVAVTNVPELNKWQETRNYIFGQTNNPYHTGRTTGGSSGGEAALQAAMASPISLCSDIGGSTRMPAFYCGLFGLNPTAGYTSLKGSLLRIGNEETMASIGFVSKHLSDLAPLTKVVAAYRAPELQLDVAVDIRDVKYYYAHRSKDFRMSPITKDLRECMNKVLKKLTENARTPDHVPQEYKHVAFNQMFGLWKHWMKKEAENFPKLLTGGQGEAKGTTELAKKLIGQSPYTMASIMKLLDDQIMPNMDRYWAEYFSADLKTDLVLRLDDNTVMLFPSAPSPAPYHYELYLRPFNFSYWAIWNALKFPSIQVPMGLNKHGLPIGIQVVGAPKHEAVMLAVADYIAKEFGGYVPPCKILDS